mmetsp:Transcript_15767/g.33701  ORF Transcript_15767/g.33701 Transcript_15767/m.33701 type:complete len:201 (+) Transcript_15767:96-698(+)
MAEAEAAVAAARATTEQRKALVTPAACVASRLRNRRDDGARGSYRLLARGEHAEHFHLLRRFGRVAHDAPLVIHLLDAVREELARPHARAQRGRALGAKDARARPRGEARQRRRRRAAAERVGLPRGAIRCPRRRRLDTPANTTDTTATIITFTRTPAHCSRSDVARTDAGGGEGLCVAAELTLRLVCLRGAVLLVAEAA